MSTIDNIPDNRGGAREGAGRPVASSTLLAQKMKERFVERAHEDAEQLYDALQDSAKGHFIQVKTKEGETKVYKKSPDVTALKEIHDRVWGKPKQEVDLTSKGERLEGNESLPEKVATILYEFEAKLRDEYSSSLTPKEKG